MARHDVTLKRVQVQMSGTESVEVRRRIPYGEAGQTLDVYRPPTTNHGLLTTDYQPPTMRHPVILVSGLSDIGAQ